MLIWPQTTFCPVSDALVRCARWTPSSNACPLLCACSIRTLLHATSGCSEVRWCASCGRAKRQVATLLIASAYRSRLRVHENCGKRMDCVCCNGY